MGYATSTTIELLTATAGDTLTASLARVSVAKGIRMESESQLQLFAKYTPHASNSTHATYAQIRLDYTQQAADVNDDSGGSAAFVWRSYTVEQLLSETAGVSVSQFLTKEWRIYADDANKSPTFAVPLGAKRISAQIAEQGASTNFGTLVLQVGHQCI